MCCSWRGQGKPTRSLLSDTVFTRPIGCPVCPIFPNTFLWLNPVPWWLFFVLNFSRQILLHTGSAKPRVRKVRENLPKRSTAAATDTENRRPRQRRCRRQANHDRDDHDDDGVLVCCVHWMNFRTDENWNWLPALGRTRTVRVWTTMVLRERSCCERLGPFRSLTSRTLKYDIWQVPLDKLHAPVDVISSQCSLARALSLVFFCHKQNTKNAGKPAVREGSRCPSP